MSKQTKRFNPRALTGESCTASSVYLYYKENTYAGNRVRAVYRYAKKALADNGPMRRSNLILAVRHKFRNRPPNLNLSIFEILEFLHLDDKLTKSLDENKKAVYSLPKAKKKR